MFAFLFNSLACVLSFAGLPPRPRTDSSSTLAFTCAIAPWEALSELAPSLGSNSIVVADLDEPEAPNIQEASSAAQHQQRLLQLGSLRASTKILLTRESLPTTHMRKYPSTIGTETECTQYDRLHPFPLLA